MSPVAAPGTRLDPAAAQQVFRAVLDALARPGTPARLPEAGLALAPAALLPALALADLGTGVCVLDGAGDDRWAGLLTTATSAPAVPLTDARLVVALRPVVLGELRALRPGSPTAPENAAVATLAVPSLDSGPELLLAGPGTRPGTRIAPGGLPAGWRDARAATAFPAGADLLLVEPDGRLVGLPRSTRVVGVIEQRGH
ncbi:phosphonate C-P lyase system protein PhnH [Pseudonocardia sp. H11422]|uniref:phosphonate C-P lyase system protein PhnH n=1 Tax=Pseudonocardia sp. H11422 TaxID=2835866 RepID=UPI001BDD33B4|nr:phosphonate C-P lyase system protein PhnH [Pseudonocardia sp. H11422]